MSRLSRLMERVAPAASVLATLLFGRHGRAFSDQRLALGRTE